MHNLKEPNPLNVFEARRLEFMPPHFDSVSIPVKYNLDRSIDKWIFSHLKGRYYIGRSVGLVNNALETGIKIGFEETKELSYFMLACPHLKYK